MLKFRIVFLFLITEIIVTPLSSQYITPDDDKYVNFGEDEYINYSINPKTQKRFDVFGNFLLDGVEMFTLEENRTLFPSKGSLLFKGPEYALSFRRLVIANDQYRGFSSRVYLGDAIDTKFSSLTLDLARLNGIRWDIGGGDDYFSFIGSRISDPIFVPERPPTSYLGEPIDANTGRPIYLREGVFLLGGHYENLLGDIMKLGLTLVNAHRYDSFLSFNRNRLRGVVEPNQLRSITLKFSDDSPFTPGQGMKLYSLPVPDPVGAVQLSGAGILDGNSGQITAINPNLISYPLDIRGNQSLLLDYDIVDTTIHYLHFQTDLSGDYFISVRRQYEYIHFSEGGDGQPVPNPVPGTDTTLFSFLKRAQGSGEERGQVRIDYQLPTGITLASTNFKMNLLGIQFNSELSLNWNFSQFPTVQIPEDQGELYKNIGLAYFIQAHRKFRQFTLGGEWYSLGGTYKTDLNVYRGNDPRDLYTPKKNLVVPYQLVDDNDDMDPWPDIFEQNISDLVQENMRGEVGRNGGVFPGLDEDKDGTPDVNRNFNSIPDYLEPFILYETDPDIFVMGDDFNNNGVIDERENDPNPDYIYRPDSKGYHFFGMFLPRLRGLNNLKIQSGYYYLEEVLGPGTAGLAYCKLDYPIKILGLGELQFKTFQKRVRDQVQDHYFVYDFLNGSYTFTEDVLNMQNSFLQTYFVGSKINRFKNLTIYNNLKLDLNHLLGGPDINDNNQGARNILFVGFVSKADYRIDWNQFTILPMVKNMWWKWLMTKPDQDLAWNNLFVPILRVDYKLTERTKLRTGFQGLPGLPEIYNNYLDQDPLQEGYPSYRGSTYLFMISNQSKYGGFDLVINLGLQKTLLTQSDDNQSDFDKYFIRVYASSGEGGL